MQFIALLCVLNYNSSLFYMKNTEPNEILTHTLCIATKVLISLQKDSWILLRN